VNHCCGKSHAICDNTVLRANRHQWLPTFTPAEAGIQCSDPWGMQGWVDLGVGYIWRLLRLPIPGCEVTSIWNTYFKYMVCNLYFIFDSVLKCILYFKYIFHCNLYFKYFNLRFEYWMHANWIRIQISKPKFENLNLIYHFVYPMMSWGLTADLLCCDQTVNPGTYVVREVAGPVVRQSIRSFERLQMEMQEYYDSYTPSRLRGLDFRPGKVTNTAVPNSLFIFGWMIG